MSCEARLGADDPCRALFLWAVEHQKMRGKHLRKQAQLHGVSPGRIHDRPCIAVLESDQRAAMLSGKTNDDEMKA